ncbi:excitatory amino acid transporter 1-like [Pygocentrus nattereri]|uniref:excitatory amino acid transporter 1-like n=1 Tax=Pygocentrus nattereri TaxID=42514 RepID=UPI001891DD8E|nr:excitatory amino acid transporter 1-like [Pygocentrus nattereri]
MSQSNGETQPPRGRVRQLRDTITERSLRARNTVQNIRPRDVGAFFRRNAFVILTVIAVIIGIILGFSLRPYKMSYREVKYFSFPGELLMRMLQMLVLPLLVSSLITGMAALDSRASGKMGIRAVVYYTTTTVIAVIIGIVMVLIIHPGRGSRDEFSSKQSIEQVSPADAFLDLIRNMFPPNLVQACTQQLSPERETPSRTHSRDKASALLRERHPAGKAHDPPSHQSMTFISEVLKKACSLLDVVPEYRAELSLKKETCTFYSTFLLPVTRVDLHIHVPPFLSFTAVKVLVVVVVMVSLSGLFVFTDLN